MGIVGAALSRAARGAGPATLAWLAVGCGRWGFGTASLDDAATPDSASLSPDGPPLEICNGIDDNGDGLIDEGCPCVPFDLTINDDAVRGGDGAVWTGTELDLVSSETTLKIDRVRDGMVLPSIDLGGPMFAGYAAAWTGSAVAVVWSDNTSLNVTMYTPATGAVGPTTLLAPFAVIPRVAWAGDRLVTGWIAGGAVYIRELDPTGVPLGPARMISTTTMTTVDAVIATPRSYALGVEVIQSASYALVVVDRQTYAATTIIPDLGSGISMRLRAEPGGIAATLGAPNSVAKLQRFTAAGAALGAGVPLPVGPNGAFQGVAMIGSSSSIQLVGFNAASAHDLMSVSYDPAALTFGPVMIQGGFSSGAYGSLPNGFGNDGRVGIVEFYTSAGSKMLVIQRCM